MANAVVGIDLADRKEMVVVCDHDSKVLARRTFRCKAWELGVALDWAAESARLAGFTGVTVTCEPTGHRWRVLGQLAAERGMPFVCVQPMLSSLACRGEDLTSDKTDDKDAVLIARLTAQLRCYLPEPVDPVWGRLRHLGARREQLLENHTRCVRRCQHRLDQRHEMAPSGGMSPQLMDVQVRDGATWTKCGLPPEEKVRCSNLDGDQARPPVSWPSASKGAKGAQPEKPSKGGWPRTRRHIACPPPPRRRHPGALAVSSQLMQRIDR